MAAVGIEGSAGPSGVDSIGWCQMCSSFKSASSELCKSLAMVARHICMLTHKAWPLFLPLVSLHIQDATPWQPPAPQVSGCEAAVQAKGDIFHDTNTEAILQVDATNAFNSLNRRF